MLLVSAAALQACAAQDPATRAAEQAQLESEDDAACREKGTPDSEAYEACRQALDQMRAEQSAIREQKRRDFDRVLGAGTDGQSGY
jgi:hypothetical protein